MSQKRIKVSLDFGTSILEAGTLVEQNQEIYFRFEDSFLESDLEISPFKLKKTTEILLSPRAPFDGLFGIFNDSIPDGWGRLLLDRKLIESGKNPKEISVLDRLSLLGKNAQGALIYEPITDEGKPENELINLDQITEESEDLLKTGNASFLDQLYHLGGNSVGARPKIFVNYNTKLNQYSTVIQEGFEPWIIKFPALNDFKDIARIEYAYYKMALACGIEMSESNLFFSEKGKVFFGTKRFDRIGNQRLHLHSACGLLHDDFRYSTLDYGHVMDAANRLENNLTACEKVFRLAVFNVYASNMDDHSKNVAFLMNQNGNWRLAPAYDLTFSPSPGGYHSLSVANTYQEIGKNDLLKLASYFGINNGNEIIEQVKEVLSTWKKFSTEFEVSKKESHLIEKTLVQKLAE
ncbi:MAG: type II toxin-antitoxin system HipA family toxin [Bacteroidetes bacterium]|nr:type II toxin-antitoxin system HipA family toxin [Bacteroidota bacterium]